MEDGGNGIGQEGQLIMNMLALWTTGAQACLGPLGSTLEPLGSTLEQHSELSHLGGLFSTNMGPSLVDPGGANSDCSPAHLSQPWKVWGMKTQKQECQGTGAEHLL